MKFSLTRLFITRPTLVFVIVALMVFAGVLSTATIVKELYPDVSQPTVTISVTFNGASVTEMRDEIVTPLEENLAGTPDLQTINSVVQQGQASISAIFTVTSDTATDLALTNKAVQASEKLLPTNITPPTVNLRDPTESVVVTLALFSKKLSLANLSLYAQNVIAPALEQIPGISFANVGGAVTPAYEIVVDPAKLAAANLTINDIVTTITNDNQRVPGDSHTNPIAKRPSTYAAIFKISTRCAISRSCPGGRRCCERAGSASDELPRGYLRDAGRRRSVDREQRGRPDRRRLDDQCRKRAEASIRTDQR